MKKLWLFLALVLVIALVGFGVFLSRWEIPPPKGEIETVIPDENFPK